MAIWGQGERSQIVSSWSFLGCAILQVSSSAIALSIDYWNLELLRPIKYTYMYILSYRSARTKVNEVGGGEPTGVIPKTLRGTLEVPTLHSRTLRGAEDPTRHSKTLRGTRRPYAALLGSFCFYVA